MRLDNIADSERSFDQHLAAGANPLLIRGVISLSLLVLMAEIMAKSQMVPTLAKPYTTKYRPLP